MFQPLDGPSVQGAISVTNSLVKELKVNASVFPDRLIISFQPLNGNVYIYFGDGVNTPSVSDMQTKGFVYYQNNIYEIEASVGQPIFVLAVSTTVNLILAERG